jgi:hypothetical protein
VYLLPWCIYYRGAPADEQAHAPWLIVLDSDELLGLQQPQATVGQLAFWFEQNNWQSVYLQWRTFGTSGIIDLHPGDKGGDGGGKWGSVLESFHQRMPSEWELIERDGNASAMYAGIQMCKANAVPHVNNGKSMMQVRERESGKSMMRKVSGVRVFFVICLKIPSTWPLPLSSLHLPASTLFHTGWVLSSRRVISSPLPEHYR